MKLSLNASTIKPAPLLDKIRIAGEAGYQGIELWAVELYEHVGRGGEISEVESALRRHNLEVPALIAVRHWGETSGREYELALEEARRRFELADRLNAHRVICTPPIERDGIDGLEQGYTDLLQIGRETGARAVLEYISFFQSLNNLNDAVTVLDRTEASDACLVVDSFHSWNSRSSQEDLLALPLERLSHYHINDAAPHLPPGEQRDPDRVMIGDGPIDLRYELQTLKDKGYSEWISLELFNAELWKQDPREVARTGLKRMEALLADLD